MEPSGRKGLHLATPVLDPEWSSVKSQPYRALKAILACWIQGLDDLYRFCGLQGRKDFNLAYILRLTERKDGMIRYTCELYDFRFETRRRVHWAKNSNAGRPGSNSANLHKKR